MRLYEEILKGVQNAGARYTVAIGGGGYFEGVKRVGDFSPQKVVLYFSKCSLEITGENLAIKKYCEGDLELSGKICIATLIEGENAGGKDGRA